MSRIPPHQTDGPLPAPADTPLHRFLQASPCFCQLAPDEQKLLLESARLQLFQADELIFLEGDQAAGLWWIEQGVVRIVKISPEGDERILHLAGPGESFNDIPVYDNGRNPATTITQTPAKLWLLPADTIRSLVRQNPAFAQAVIRLLAQRVRHFTTQIETLTLYDVTARLARFLLQQAADGALAEAGITRKAMAAYLATTPESISRTLRTLQEAGAIQFDRHRIMIVNPETLRRLAQL